MLSVRGPFVYSATAALQFVNLLGFWAGLRFRESSWTIGETSYVRLKEVSSFYKNRTKRRMSVFAHRVAVYLLRGSYFFV
jgi:hypothetical protein